MAQIEHRASPDAGMPGIGDEDGVIWQMLAQFLAEPFGAHGQLV